MKFRKIFRWFIGVFLVVVAIPLIAPFVGFAWSPINCRHQEIDLETGRARYTTMLYWIPISREIKHTELSEQLGEDLKSDDGDWRKVNTFSPGRRHSPHYLFHGAFSQIKNLEWIWEEGALTSQARKESAREVLRLWAETDSESGAGDYIAKLSSF